MMRILSVAVLSTALTACYGAAPPPPPPPIELYGSADCASTVFPADPAISAGAADRYSGVYRLGRESVTVSRQDHRFLVHRVLYGVRELRFDPPGGATFSDACGLAYAFSLAESGSGAWLTITSPDGTSSRWRRQAY